MASNTTRTKKTPLPSFAASIAKRYPVVWEAYSNLGEAIATAGPLTERERRLVKLALAVGSGSEGATHSHTRQAVADGLTPAEVRHVALLAITTIGWPNSAAALSWLEDVLSHELDRKRGSNDEIVKANRKGRHSTIS